VTAGKALVLGAAGFIGRHVCRALAANGLVVYGVGHGRWTSQEWSAWGLSRWQSADITLESMDAIAGGEQVGAIFQCAGSGAVARSYAAPLDDFHRTVSSTASALEFARTRCGGHARFVLASSAAVYGDQGEVDLAESAVRAPVSPYGFSKVAAENLCETYARFFGVQSSVIRMFSVYGEGLRKQLLWDAMRKFATGESKFFGTGHEMRDWIHVDDAAALLCVAGTAAQEKFEIYNCGHVKASTQDVLAQLATLAGGALTPRFTGESHPGNPRRLTANCARAARTLGWTARVTLAEGLGRYVRWFQTAASNDL
jgi:UDP-glucose 4-epimerase